MSDDQKTDNLPGVDPDIKGGWHQPAEPTLWQEPEGEVEEDSQPFDFWKKMPAFPDDVAERPQEQGGWHLPSPEDTILNQGDEITKGEPIEVEQADEPDTSDAGESPEDMIARLLGERPTTPSQPTTSLAPEDVDIPAERPEDTDLTPESSAVAPEDFEIPSQRPEDTEMTEDEETDEVEDEADESEEEIVDEIIDDTLDEMDDDDDAFTEDEMTALQEMVAAEDGEVEEIDDTEDEEVDTEDDIDEADEDDGMDELDRVAKKITDDLEPALPDSSSVEVPAVSEEDAQDAASIAAEMLRQLEEEEDSTVSLDATDAMDILDENEDIGNEFSRLVGGTSDLSPKEAARQALQELENAGQSDASGAYPLPDQQQTPRLDPTTREYAEQFRNVQNQVATLTNMYNNEEMSYDEYQRLLYENMAQDENGIWWMIGPDTNTWYRHNPETNAWEEDYPPALSALEEYEQAEQANDYQQGQQTQDDYGFPTSEPTEFDLPPVDGTQGPQPGDTLYDDQGVPYGQVPDQSDPQYTQVSPSAYKDELTSQQETMPSDGGFGATMPSDSRSAETVPINTFDAQTYEGVQSAVDTSEPGDYSIDEPAPTVQQAKNEQRNQAIRVIAFATIGVVALALIFFILAAVGIVLWYNNAVDPYREQIAALADYDPPFQTARIYDANGDLIVELNSSDTGARTAIPLDEMSPYIIHAIVSQENERYYEDPGFDPIAIVRAFLQNIAGGDLESGASTITQQIARNLVLQDTEVTTERKINEVLVALEIANQYDKNFVLELYLNEVFFGNQSYGVEAASQFYFEHGADELNFAESALLASIVPSPALNDPVVNRPTAINNMRETMQKMLEVGCLQFQHGDWLNRGPFCVTEDTTVQFDGDEVFLLRLNRQGEINGGLATLQIAEIETAEFQPRNIRLQYPHFVNYIQSEIEAEFGVNALFQRGFNIYTTLIPGVQETAQETLTRQVEVLVDTGVNTGAVMVTDPNTGAIRAMVGSHDFSDEVAGQVNNALTYQQPGSAIKPVVYTAGLVGNQGVYLTPATILWDVPVTYDLGNGQTYRPVNFDRQFHGPTPLRFALQNSYNVAAVKAYATIGGQKFLETAQAMGLQFPESSQIGLPSALGANEVRLYDMMQAYGVFANGGQRTELYAIERITETVDGGEVEVARPARPQPVQAISPQVAYLMQNILSDDNARAEQFGTNSNLTLARLGFPTQNRVSAKTGTSNDSRDLWTMGFTRNVVVGVWLGTYDNAPTFGTTGFNSASPVWNVVMEAALRGRTPPEFNNPGGVVAREICRTTGTLSYASCPQRTTDIFVQDRFPPPPDQGFVQTIAIDSWTGLRANEFCDDYVVEETFADINDPSAVEWLNTTQAGRAYAQQVGLPTPLQAPPAQACSQGQTLPSISISFPNVNSTVTGQVAIRGQVQAPNFAQYELSYSGANQPNTFVPITTSTTPVPTNGSELGVWDTMPLPNGNYTIRLTVTSTNGGIIVEDIPVTVDNPVPTATPVPLPTSTPFDSGSSASGVTASTAIPFRDDEVIIPTITPQGGIVPTITPLGG